MKEKNLICSFFILMLIIFVQSKDYRLPTNVIPRDYKLYLNPDLTSSRFDGSVKITVDILNITNSITLHSSKLVIDSSQTTLANSSINTKPLFYNSEDTKFLIFNFGIDLYPGRYVLEIKYKGDLGNDKKGFFKDLYKDEKNQTT